VTPTTVNTAAASAAVNPFAQFNSVAGAPVSTSSATEDRFMTLLVAQMKNQDPLNPTDNAQITSQLAQIDTARGMTQLNQTLNTMLGNTDSAQTLQAAALVGHSVLTPGNSLNLGAGGAAGGFELAHSADNVTITITDASGRVVHRADLGVTAAGTHRFAWDGQTDSGSAAQAGAYTFSVSALANGKASSADGLMVSTVEGITPGAAGATLQLRGGAAVPLAQIKQIM
jgi:flagellar basal-body rod modification protein FlgD